MEQLEDNQRKLKLLMKVSRGKMFSQWCYGEMRALGSRQPSGGRPGDGYGPYPGVTLSSVDDIVTLFSHAMVRDTRTIHVMIAPEQTCRTWNVYWQEWNHTQLML
jgi:hypothetical protein